MSQEDIFKLREAEQSEKDGPTFHYTFSHVALRNYALGNPIECLATLSSEGSGGFLTSLVNLVSEKLEVPATFEASEVKVFQAKVGPYPTVILEFPEPAETPENYMVALVLEVDPAQGIPENLGDVSARYFTLEKSGTISGENRVVFAEWTKTEHLNSGDGPEHPTLEEFRTRMEEAVLS